MNQSIFSKDCSDSFAQCSVPGKQQRDRHGGGRGERAEDGTGRWDVGLWGPPEAAWLLLVSRACRCACFVYTCGFVHLGVVLGTCLSSDMCVHVHLRMSACQGIKKDHAGGCEIRERGRGPLWESPVGMEAPRLHRAAEHTGGSVERAEAPPGSQGPGSENPAANHQDTQAPEVLRTP